jgi:hypothetical protein
MQPTNVVEVLVAGEFDAVRAQQHVAHDDARLRSAALHTGTDPNTSVTGGARQRRTQIISSKASFGD